MVNVGGLELNGRDADFEAALLNELKPATPSLTDLTENEDADRAAVARDLANVLRSTPLDEFLCAFFQVQQPYLLMFHRILQYFEKAGAKEGRDDWRLSLPDGTDLDLDHFKTQLARCTLVKGSLHVPALDVTSAWEILRLLPDAKWSVKDWIGNAALPLDRDALRQQLPRELHPVADLICGMASIIKETGQSRDDLLAALDRRRHRYPEDDALNIWSIVHSETDGYLSQAIQRLDVARNLPPEGLENIERRFAEIAARFPSKPLHFEVSIEEIEDILRLPIWQKRSELYAVWVGTEIIGCLDKHLVRLFHNNGKLPFEFKETLLAAVLTSRPPMELFSERRTRITAGPLYLTHTQGVQPDFGIWTAREKSAASCVMAVECKHYKKNGAGKFSAVLSDYAHALPQATVCLVSHGPIEKVLEALSSSIRKRCFVISELRADRPSTLERFHTCIREAVGPVTTDIDPAKSMQYGCALVIDVSPSMKPEIKAAHRDQSIELLRLAIRADVLVAVDTEIRVLKEASDENLAALLSFEGSDTDLSSAIRTLCKSFSRVVVVTDEDGLKTLSMFKTSACANWNASRHPNALVVEVQV